MRILLLYAFEATGHEKIAYRLAEKLSALGHGAEVFNISSISGRQARSLINAYVRTVNRLPGLWDRIYKWGRGAKGLQNLAELLAILTGRRFLDIFGEKKFDLVVATQILAGLFVLAVRERLGLQAKIAAYPCDFLPHSAWADNRFDVMFVFHKDCMNWLRQAGYRGEILNVGFPHPPNITAYERNDYILVMGGSRGVGRVERVVDALLEGGCENVLLACGKNKSLAEKAQDTWGDRIKVLGWVEDSWELIGRAGVLVTKPGGVTCAEAVVCQTPIVLFGGLGGQESANRQFLVEKGLAVEGKDAVDAAHLALRLLEDAQLYGEVRGRLGLFRDENMREAFISISRWVGDV